MRKIYAKIENDELCIFSEKKFKDSNGLYQYDTQLELSLARKGEKIDVPKVLKTFHKLSTCTKKQG